MRITLSAFGSDTSIKYTTRGHAIYEVPFLNILFQPMMPEWGRLLFHDLFFENQCPLFVIMCQMLMVSHWADWPPWTNERMSLSIGTDTDAFVGTVVLDRNHLILRDQDQFIYQSLITHLPILTAMKLL